MSIPSRIARKSPASLFLLVESCQKFLGLYETTRLFISRLTI